MSYPPPDTSIFLVVLVAIIETEEGLMETHHLRHLPPSLRTPPEFGKEGASEPPHLLRCPPNSQSLVAGPLGVQTPRDGQIPPKDLMASTYV